MFSVRDTRFAVRAFLPGLLVISVAAGSLSASEPAITQSAHRWTQVVTPHFVLYSNARTEVTRSVAQNLESMGDALARVHPRFRLSTAAPTRVFIFSSSRDAVPYIRTLLQSEKTSANGIFITHAHGGSMLIDASRDRRTSRTAYHELVHEMISNSGWSPPLWLNEGIAEFFGTVETGRREIRFGQPLMEHVRILRRRRPISLQQLFETTAASQQYLAPGHSTLFYAQSWAFTHYLMQNRSANGNEIYRLLEKLNAGVPTVAALQEVFGIPLPEMEREFLMSLRRLQMPSTKFSVLRPLVDIDVEVLDCALPDVLYQLGDLLLGTEHRTEAEDHFAAALELEPGHVRSLAGMGQVRSIEGKEQEAESFFQRAIETAAEDHVPFLVYGERLIRRGFFGAPADAGVSEVQLQMIRKARSLLRDALRRRPGDPRIEGALGTTFVIESADVGEGIALLQRSRANLPARTDLALHLFALYLIDGQENRADELMTTVLSKSTNPEVQLAARTAMIQHGVRRANSLLREQKTEEASVVIAQLAATAPPGPYRLELERKAEELRELAKFNRQIDVYNRAIGLANQLRDDKALPMIEEILPDVQDPKLRSDVERLREILKRRAGRKPQATGNR